MSPANSIASEARKVIMPNLARSTGGSVCDQVGGGAHKVAIGDHIKNGQSTAICLGIRHPAMARTKRRIMQTSRATGGRLDCVDSRCGTNDGRVAGGYTLPPCAWVPAHPHEHERAQRDGENDQPDEDQRLAGGWQVRRSSARDRLITAAAAFAQRQQPQQQRQVDDRGKKELPRAGSAGRQLHPHRADKPSPRPARTPRRNTPAPPSRAARHQADQQQRERIIRPPAAP